MGAKRDRIAARFAQIEGKLSQHPYFNGEAFSLVDAAFCPVFRYFDVFDKIADFAWFEDCPKVSVWRKSLAQRPSVQGAVAEDYEDRLRTFLLNRKAYLSELLPSAGRT